jgi:DNA-binding protein H-NS
VIARLVRTAPAQRISSKSKRPQLSRAKLPLFQHVSRIATYSKCKTISLCDLKLQSHDVDGKRDDGTVMQKENLRSMSVDELWTLHEDIAAALVAKIATEKVRLEGRLRLLSQARGHASGPTARRPYPYVPPKFRNPDEPSQTWAGRGKQPLWLKAQLRSGRAVDDFRIAAGAA